MLHSEAVAALVGRNLRVDVVFLGQRGISFSKEFRQPALTQYGSLKFGTAFRIAVSGSDTGR
jgi:hypothetical protein